MRNRAVLLAIFAGLLLAPVQGAFAFGLGGGLGSLKRQLEPRFISGRGPTLAPMGHVIFCARQPSQCRSFGRSVVAMTAVKKQELNRINTSVNHSIRPANDTSSNGWADTWSVAPQSGDCEDFALTKRAELIARGWPSRALRIAVAKTTLFF